MQFFSSDTHFGHKNIAGKSVSSWDGGFRDFDNLDQMNNHIIKCFNDTVKEDDELFHIGDWSFGGAENIWNFRKRLRCKNIHLIFGNHDTHIKNNIVLPNCISLEPYSSEFIDGKNTDPEYPNYVEAQRLFKSCNDVLTIKDGKNTFFLSHYSHRVWFGSHKGVIHLYGHSHGSIPELGKSMDVGIDSAKKILGDYKPFSLSDITRIMDNKKIHSIDKHAKLD